MDDTSETGLISPAVPRGVQGDGAAPHFREGQNGYGGTSTLHNTGGITRDLGENRGEQLEQEPARELAEQSNPGQPPRQRKKKKSKARIKLASLNMRGYGQTLQNGASDKWNMICQVMRDSKIAVLALQETHLSQDRVDAINELFAASLKVTASFDGVNTTGAKRYFDPDQMTVKELVPGRALFITLTWTAGKKLSLLNVYAPNDHHANAEFWAEVGSERTRLHLPKPDIMMGDTNIVEASIDRMPPRKDLEEAADSLKILYTSFGMTDGWRTMNEGKRGYTYLQTSTGSQSRIDRIYIANTLVRASSDWDIEGPGIVTDHRMPTCMISNYCAPFVGKGRWSMPACLLSDKPFMEIMRETAMNFQRRLEHNVQCAERTEDCNPQLLYKDFKEQLIAQARARAKEKLPKIDRQIAALKKDLENTVNPPNAEQEVDSHHAAVLQDKIAELEVKRFGVKRTFVAANNWAKGETVCKYWTRMNAAPMPSTTIPQLENDLAASPGTRTTLC
ncbi:Endonuclease/exonuclease/phosphatase [Earliella scabrosa]|nr:Endonuclease/exonuclease/phosphatase [Earliella scabrosa]